MAIRTDTFTLARLGLTSDEGRKLDLHLHIDPFSFGGQRYEAAPSLVPARLDVSRTTNSGYALRLRFSAAVDGPCVRCLEEAAPTFEVDAREVHQPGGGEELTSPYVSGEDELDVERWARDALALSLPVSILCRPDCAGLCTQCGENLNEHPGHAHEAAPDPRWAKLAEIRFE